MNGLPPSACAELFEAVAHLLDDRPDLLVDEDAFNAAIALTESLYQVTRTEFDRRIRVKDEIALLESWWGAS